MRSRSFLKAILLVVGIGIFMSLANDAIATGNVLLRHSDNKIQINYEKYCGTWEYVNSGDKYYLKISKIGSNKFKLVDGWSNEGKIEWTVPMIRNSNGIYLKPLKGKLWGKFVSSNFRPTHAEEFTYTIILSSISDNMIHYSVHFENNSEKYVATRIIN